MEVLTLKRILIIGDGELVNRLPEILSHPLIQTDAVSNENSVLAKSIFVSSFFPFLVTSDDLAWERNNQVFLEFLSQSKYDFYIYSSDSLARRVRDAELEIEAKIRVLPVRNAEMMSIIDSKSNLAIQCKRLGIPFPESTIYRTIKELEDSIGRSRDAKVLKGESGHGGKSVLLIKPHEIVPLSKLEKFRWPILMQERLEMPLVSIEALFVCGRLSAWLYSSPLRVVGKTGPSTKRIFKEPPFLDFVESLEKIASAGNLSGFFNTSWFLDSQKSRHILFELDVRPNVWHKYGPSLGVDWRAFLLSDNLNLIDHQPKVIHLKKVIYAYPRHLIWGLQRMNLLDIFVWVFRIRGTWDLAPRKDLAVNRFNSNEIARFWRNWYQAFVFNGWKILPIAIKESLTTSKRKDDIARFLGF